MGSGFGIIYLIEIIARCARGSQKFIFGSLRNEIINCVNTKTRRIRRPVELMLRQCYVVFENYTRCIYVFTFPTDFRVNV